MSRPLHRRRYTAAGRLVPRSARGLRAGSVILQPGEVMDWHSTQKREELLIALRGTVRLEVRRASRVRGWMIRAGSCVLVPRRTRHRVVNRSAGAAHYLYVTTPAS